MAKTGGGSIINISSLASLKPTLLTTVYSAAMAGLNALTRPSTPEYAGAGVRVSCIVCGTFDTDATANFVRNPSLPAAVVKPIALQGGGPPEDSAKAVAFFASPQAEWITGQVLNVCGGLGVHRGDSFESLARMVVGDGAKNP
jgi:NAD(P)-dependent dehydrogenase (short-subunit alcohol dehydrogenase family)